MIRALSIALLLSGFWFLVSGFPQDLPEVARALLEEAEQAQQANRIDDAIAKYQRVIEVAPSLASAYTNLGALYFKQGKTEEAYKTFAAGVQKAPADRTLLSNAAAAALRVGKASEALGYVDRGVEMNPRDASLFLLRGTILRTLGRKDEAFAALRKAGELDPNDAKVQFSLGNLLFQLGRKDEAINAFGRATALDRSMVRAWYNLGAALFETGRYDEALSAYKMALAPIEQAFARGDKVDPVNARAYANLGAIYLKQQQWQPAIDAYEKALRLDPNDTTAHYNLGFIFFTAGNAKRAEEEYRKALARDPALPLAHLHLGQIELQRGETETAIASFRAGMPSFDNDQKLAAFRFIGKAELARHDDAAALAAFDDALKIAPNDVESVLNAGRIERRSKNLTAAAATLDRAPADLDVMTERALVARDAGDFANERKLLEQIVAKRDAKPLRAELVVAMLRLGDIDAARKELDAIGDFAPLAGVSDALRNAGVLAGWTGGVPPPRTRDASAPAAETAAFRGDEGLRLWQLGKFNDARPLLAEAHAASANWTAVTLALGEVALANHEYDTAAQLLTSKCEPGVAAAASPAGVEIALGTDGDLCTRMKQSAATALLLQASDELDRAVRRGDDSAARRARQLAERATSLDERQAAAAHFIRGTSELIGGSDAAAREEINHAIALGLPPTVEAVAKKNLEMPAPVKEEPTSAEPHRTVVAFLPDAPADEKRVAETMTSLVAQTASASGVPLQVELFRRADDARAFIAANRDKVGIVIANAEFLGGDLTPHFQLTREGRSSYHRVVIVAAKSAIHSLDALRGHTVSSPDALRDAGTGTPVHVTDDYTAVANVLYGKSDAAYVSEANPLLLQRAKDLRVIHTGAAQPLPLIAFAPMPANERAAIDAALASAAPRALAAMEMSAAHIETRRAEAKKIETAALPIRMPGEALQVAMRVVVPLPKIVE